IAFWLELDSPSTATVTVLIVAAPVRGMILSKSLYRLLGTLFGGAVALVLVDLCGQNSELFILAVALWVALCTALATLLRNFRAYACVLAGYTVPLIGMAAIQAPDHTFDIAIARVAAITIGLVCAAAASAVLPGSAQKDLIPRIRTALGQMLALARGALAPKGDPAGEHKYIEATANILELDNQIEFAATESPRVALQANALRSAIAAMAGCVTTLRAIAGSAPPDRAAQSGAMEALGSALERLSCRLQFRLQAGEGSYADILGDMRARLHLAEQHVEAEAAPNLGQLQLVENLNELVDRIEAILSDLEAAVEMREGRTVAKIGYHADAGAAWRNGIRAFLGVIAAGAFGYITGWSDGYTSVVAVAVICSLLALTPNPAKASIAFAIGVGMGDLAAIFCVFVLLAQAQGFPLLAMSMAPFLFVALLNPATPLLGGIAGGFRIFFVVAVAPTNPMVFNAASTLNLALVSFVGAILAAYFYRAILPRDEEAEGQRVARSIRRTVAKTIKASTFDRIALESRIYGQLITLAGRLNLSSPDGRTLLAKAYAGARLALAVQRARIALEAEDVPDEARRTLEKAIARADETPAFRDAALAIAVLRPPPGAPGRGPILRAAAALAEADAIQNESQRLSHAA
ncbi:MAG TPA: FUSC family protein, partial [Rhodoblastus sp.]|nr:FUSC family protein [Rhodoblastus sp.]